VRVMKRLGLLVAGITLCACGGADSTALGTFTGRYTLVLVDGQVLPFHGALAFTVRGDVNIKSGGRYTSTQVDSTAAGALTTITANGQWSLQENAIALIDDAGPLQLGVISSDTLRMTYRGHENVYVRK
jgi:hypothetical protein